MPTLLFVFVLWWLMFDQLIYEYHFTTLTTIAACGVLLERSWQTVPARTLGCGRRHDRPRLGGVCPIQICRAGVSRSVSRV